MLGCSNIEPQITFMCIFAVSTKIQVIFCNFSLWKQYLGLLLSLTCIKVNQVIRPVFSRSRHWVLIQTCAILVLNTLHRSRTTLRIFQTIAKQNYAQRGRIFQTKLEVCLPRLGIDFGRRFSQLFEVVAALMVLLEDVTLLCRFSWA